MEPSAPISITYYSDVLCVWAYAAQERLDQVQRSFGEHVAIGFKSCSVFGNTTRKIGDGWREKGGYAGFGAHVREAAAQFDHIEVHPEIWLTARPASSEGAHLFLAALSLVENGGALDGCNRLPERTPSEEYAWRLRLAFFRDCRDIAQWHVQCEVAEDMGIGLAPVEAAIRDGSAFAALASDHQDKVRFAIEGSPTFLMNQGRQKIYGNVGYRVIEANIRELLHVPQTGEMSWC